MFVTDCYEYHVTQHVSPNKQTIGLLLLFYFVTLTVVLYMLDEFYIISQSQNEKLQFSDYIKWQQVSRLLVCCFCPYNAIFSYTFQ